MNARDIVEANEKNAKIQATLKQVIISIYLFEGVIYREICIVLMILHTFIWICILYI